MLRRQHEELADKVKENKKNKLLKNADLLNMPIFTSSLEMDQCDHTSNRNMVENH